MLRTTAAAYCDMSPDQFDRQCPVAPKDQGWRGYRWDKQQLDVWIDAIPSRSDHPAPEIEAPALTPEERRKQIVAAFDPPALTAEERRRRSLARIDDNPARKRKKD